MMASGTRWPRTHSTVLDSGFGYANAALGTFSQYLQQERFVEGSMIYNNTEFYLQDNWKTTDRLTLDYGVRFYYLTPQWDVSKVASNFLPDQFVASQAVPGPALVVFLYPIRFEHDALARADEIGREFQEREGFAEDASAALGWNAGPTARSVMQTRRRAGRRDEPMLKWALIFLVIALIAGALGLTPVARGAALISKILFAIFFIGLAIVILVVILAVMAGEAIF